MIVRMWRGHVPKAKKDDYVAYLKQTGLADYGNIPGNRGVYLLSRDDGDNVEFLTLTLGTAVEAIQAFAGADYDKARYYPEDGAFLLNFMEKAEHFEVLYQRANGAERG